MEAEQRGGRARRAAPQCVPRPRLRPSAARRSAYSQYSAVDAFIGAGISHTPEKILDAPDLLDDYYLNLLDWSSACVSSLRSCLSAPSAPTAPCLHAHSLERWLRSPVPPQQRARRRARHDRVSLERVHQPHPAAHARALRVRHPRAPALGGPVAADSLYYNRNLPFSAARGTPL